MSQQTFVVVVYYALLLLLLLVVVSFKMNCVLFPGAKGSSRLHSRIPEDTALLHLDARGRMSPLQFGNIATRKQMGQSVPAEKLQKDEKKRPRI